MGHHIQGFVLASALAPALCEQLAGGAVTVPLGAGMTFVPLTHRVYDALQQASPELTKGRDGFMLLSGAVERVAVRVSVQGQWRTSRRSTSGASANKPPRFGDTEKSACCGMGRAARSTKRWRSLESSDLGATMSSMQSDWASTGTWTTGTMTTRTVYEACGGPPEVGA